MPNSTHKPRRKPRRWVRGPALQTVLALKAIAPGDEVWCLQCSRIHIAIGYLPPRYGEYLSVRRGRQVSNLTMSDIGGWRPGLKEEVHD